MSNSIEEAFRKTKVQILAVSESLSDASCKLTSSLATDIMPMRKSSRSMWKPSSGKTQTERTEGRQWVHYGLMSHVSCQSCSFSSHGFVVVVVVVVVVIVIVVFNCVTVSKQGFIVSRRSFSNSWLGTRNKCITAWLYTHKWRVLRMWPARCWQTKLH